MRVIVLCCMLTGCASFGPPTFQEVLAEQQACSESWACRTFIEDRPVALVAAVRDDPLDTRCTLASVGFRSYQHGPYVIVLLDGRHYAIGHSWTCDGVCSKDEAMHSIEAHSSD